jgi:hypothetical protein
MEYIYDELKLQMKDTLEKLLNEIGLKNFRLVHFSRGATYPTPEVINFKILSNNSVTYFSLNTRIDFELDCKSDVVFGNITLSLNMSEDYTVNYITGGYHNTNKIIKNFVENKKYAIGTAKYISIRDYGAGWNGWNWSDEDEALKNYEEQTGSTLVAIESYHIDKIEATTMVNKLLSVLGSYIKEYKEIILDTLNTDTIYDHLNEFEHLTRDEFERIKEEDIPVYFREDYEFILYNKDELENIKYNVPYGTIMGFRRIFIYNDAIYLWFGGDQVCSLDC